MEQASDFLKVIKKTASHCLDYDYRSAIYFYNVNRKTDYYDLGTTPVTFESISLV